MTDDFIKVLNNLMNYGIREEEKLTNKERIERISEFKKDFSLRSQMDLFKSLQIYLMNGEISSDEKETVILLMLDFIRSFFILESNIEKLPPVIIHIYNSHMALVRLMFLFESASLVSEIADYVELKNVIKDYIDYLDDPNNEFYIHNCYSRIMHFNKAIQTYLDNKNIKGIKHRDAINDIHLILLFSQKVCALNIIRTRKKANQS